MWGRHSLVYYHETRFETVGLPVAGGARMSLVACSLPVRTVLAVVHPSRNRLGNEFCSLLKISLDVMAEMTGLLSR